VKKALAIVLVLFSAACSRPETVAVPALSETPEQMLGKIRAQGDVGDELMFQALADEAIVDLREQAARAEADGDRAKAAELLDRALALNAADPQALQARAELAILERSWPLAERLARQSFASGPKLGPLCRRNWLTLHYAALAQGHALPDQELAQNLGECTLVPPARL